MSAAISSNVLPSSSIFIAWPFTNTKGVALTDIYSVAELTRIASDELRIKKKNGTPLSHNAIRKLLKNPFYAGKFRWAGRLYNGIHPPMISESEFEQLQEILKPTKKCE